MSGRTANHRQPHAYLTYVVLVRVVRVVVGRVLCTHTSREGGSHSRRRLSVPQDWKIG